MWGQGMSQLHQWQEQGPLQHKLQQLLHTLQQKYPEVQRLLWRCMTMAAIG
jgi:hypothetical protein